MIFRRIAILSTLILTAALFGQSSPRDTLPRPPISPELKPRESKFDFTGYNIAWAGGYIPNVAFFEPADHKLDDAYLPVIEELAWRMVQNPDLRCHIRGYYSHEFDGIVSPTEGEALAYRRAEALREALVLGHPQLALRAGVATTGYNATRVFGALPSVYDLRAEIVPWLMDWNERVIVATDAQPYWRRGFRQISETWADFLVETLERNPDLILLFSSGELGVSPKEAASRIDGVVSRFQRDMKRRDGRRMAAVHKGMSKSGEMLIDIVPSIFAPEPLNGKLMWFEAPGDVEPIRLELSFDTASTAHSFRIDRDMHGSRTAVDWGMRRPTALSIVRPREGKPLVVPPSCEFSLAMWGDNSLVERSSWRTVDIAFGPEYTEMAVAPIIPFEYGGIEPRIHWESALPPVVSRLELLTKRAGALNIRITGHANEREDNADSLAELRAEYLWTRLSDALMALFNRDTLEDLGKYLSGRGVAVEIDWEVHRGDTSKDIMPWAIGAIAELPPEHLVPLSAVATIKWEFRCEK
ncbi:MAG TPA: hypothetical protein ENN07_04375 [candidate division Zixibacteria bacterium]|nr:hypothetical protein [candidate division Zixibacteria bacterium]